jgi:putative ABC transport system permease protein
MQQLLKDADYRIELSWWMFALSGFVALLIAVVTVSFQGVKAALRNPVKSLRME